ncbi:MAG: PAS domain S-box protein [Reyranella sp.]
MNGSRGVLARGNNHRLAAVLAVVLPALGIVGAWRITAGEDELLHVAQFLDLLVSPWMLATYAAVAALIAASVAFLRFGHRVVGQGGDLEVTLRRQARFWIAAYLVFAALTAGIGWLFGLELHESMLRDRFEQQRAIARLKAQQIDKWAAERLLDADLLASSLAGLAYDGLRGDGVESRQLVLGLTEFLAGYPERVAVTLYVPDGTMLAHLGKGAGPDRQMTAAVESLTATGRKNLLVDAYRTDETPAQVHMGIVEAVGTRGRQSPRAYVASTLDPFRVLFKEVMVWPGPSPSSEIVVVRRDGDDILYLTPLRLSPATSGPMQFRERIEGSRLPATRALLEGDGTRLGIDYRGVEVMTASQRVERLPWTVVAKTDYAEAMVPVREKQRRVAAAVAVTLMLAAAMMLFMARGQRAGTLAYFSRLEAERSTATQRYAHLVRHARDIVLTLDPEGRIVEANEAAVRAYGYSMEELKGLTVRDLRTAAEFARHAQQWAGSQTPDGVLFETVHRRKDGSTFPVEVSGRTVEVEGQPLRQAFIRDITRRRELQSDVARLAHIQRAMQAGTRILLRADSEPDLLQGMCDAIVDIAGYRLAAVGIANRDEGKTISYVASAGASDGYFEQARSTWGPGSYGRGTTGTAIRLGTV